jgi:CDP-6-deoxy-D-xylo-4-hexulose-3-dehydrase
MTTMEGGGIATNSDAIANDLKSIRSHGWSRDRFDKHRVERNIDRSRQKYLFVTTGFNIRPMEIQAAIGLSQLKDLDQFVIRRRNIARKVSKALQNSKLSVIGEQYLVNLNQSQRHSWMLLPIKIQSGNHRIRSRITTYLEKIGIENRPVLTGNFLKQPALRHLTNPPSAKEFSNADEIEKTCFLVSCHHDLSESQVRYLIRGLLKAQTQI